MKRLLFAAMLTLASAAQAQGTTGSLRSGTGALRQDFDHEGQMTQVEARRFTAKFADCVVAEYPAKVRKAFELPQNSPEQMAALHKVFDPACISGTSGVQSSGLDVSFNIAPSSFRYALMRALLKRDKPIDGARFADFASPIAADRSLMLRFADCIVRLEPAASHDLVVAVPASRDEDAGLAAIQAAMSQCLPPNVTLKMDRHSLLSNLAEAYFLEAQAYKSVSAN